MIKLLAVAIACLVVSVFAEDVASQRIIDAVGNFPASQFPAVALVSNANEFASGSLISPDFVLTAAHVCTDTNGIPNLPATTVTLNGTTRNVIRYFVHPTWQGSPGIPGQSDAALLQLDVPVTTMAPLPIGRHPLAVGSVITIAGYGYEGTGTTGTNGTPPPAGTICYGSVQIDSETQDLFRWVFSSSP